MYLVTVFISLSGKLIIFLALAIRGIYGAITVTLRPGTAHDQAKIINCGSNGNDVSVYPEVTTQLFGAGNGVASILSDGEVISIDKNVTEGWW